jgi:hypothetical protein
MTTDRTPHKAKVSCNARILGAHREPCLVCGLPCQEVATGFREDSPEQEPETYWRHMPAKEPR